MTIGFHFSLFIGDDIVLPIIVVSRTVIHAESDLALSGPAVYAYTVQLNSAIVDCLGFDVVFSIEYNVYDAILFLTLSNFVFVRVIKRIHLILEVDLKL